jgi:carboxypeptidase C (cathepsin A)
MKANWIGVHDSMVAMSWYGNKLLNSTEFKTLKMGGEGVATYKTVDQFQFARVFGAGHVMVRDM